MKRIWQIAVDGRDVTMVADPEGANIVCRAKLGPDENVFGRIAKMLRVTDAWAYGQENGAVR